uniref:F-box domain-containing protein n=2 Tax=Caenorhabditis tropicalis TaxID=1561998 RepID=A0A1I7U622_9PELO
MVTMSSVDEELSNKVFNNPLLLEYILSYVVSDFLPNFKIRLTNKHFNNACLTVTRSALRKMTIDFKEKSDGQQVMGIEDSTM